MSLPTLTSPVPINSTIYVHHGIPSSTSSYQKPHKATVLHFAPPNELFVQFYSSVPTNKGPVTQDYVKIWRIVAKGTLSRSKAESLKYTAPIMPRMRANPQRAQLAGSVSSQNAMLLDSTNISGTSATLTSPSPPLNKKRKLPLASIRTSPKKVHFAQSSPLSGNSSNLSNTPHTPTSHNGIKFLSPSPTNGAAGRRRINILSPTSKDGSPTILEENAPFQKGERVPEIVVGVSLSLRASSHGITATLVRPNGHMQAVDLSEIQLEASVDDFFYEKMDSDDIVYVPHVERKTRKQHKKSDPQKVAMVLSGNTDNYWYKELSRSPSSAIRISQSFTNSSPTTNSITLSPLPQARKTFLNIDTGSPKRNYSLRRLSQSSALTNPSETQLSPNGFSFSASNGSASIGDSKEKLPAANRYTFQEFIVSLKRKIDYLIGRPVERLVVSVPICGTSSYPPQNLFLSDTKKLRMENVSVSVIHHGCSSTIAYGIKGKCIALHLDASRDVLRASLLNCHRGKCSPLHTKKAWIGTNDFVDRLFNLALSQLRKEFDYLPLYDSEMHDRIRAHCQRATNSLLVYGKTCIEIYELTPEIPIFRMEITREGLYAQCEDIFHQLDELLDKTEQEISRSFNLAFSNVDCVILVGESAGHYAERVRERFTEKEVLFDTEQCRVSRGAALFGLQHTQKELLAMILQTTETKQRFTRVSSVARHVKKLLNLQTKSDPLKRLQDIHRAYSPVDLGDIG